MSFFASSESAARFLVTSFFAIVFLQSAADKLFDPEGNIAYFSDHFKNSPIFGSRIRRIFWILTGVEGLAGALCALGILTRGFAHRGTSAASWGVWMAGFALLCLLAGQRAAKDYAGAAVVAAYFAVALIGVALF